ncbi:metalloendopeptidase, partial [Coemansia biformis]
ELAELEALKRADVESAGEAYSGFYAWDRSYYKRLLDQQEHKLDEAEIRQYFPLVQVTRGILDIFQAMLGLRVVQVDSPPVWHPDVTMYEVWEAAEKDVFVGHIYLDLFPRKGKYNHAAMGQLRSGYEREDGTREYPVAAMMANFPKPTLAVPSLLTHRNVVTLMHELGHVFHGLCAHTKWSSFHGTRVVADFIEAPSQMLENWAWEPEALRKFAVHHETGAPMPEDLVAKIAASKSKGLAGDILRKVFYGTYDLAIHNTVDGHIDVLQTYNDMQSNITMIGNGDAETCK